ncbi:MAG: YdcF family protein [Rhodopila sp.]|nr:YdcF family protein [Rhodopila sp.]
MTRLQILPRVLAAIAMAGAACWIGGFFWFVQVTRRPAEPPPPHVDGIVALTGGAGRVELALHLLATGQADKLLVSGIGGGTEMATLGRLAGIDTAPLAERITLGRYAGSTRGNGLETAAWAAQNRIGSLIVVTAAYHMPRALTELHQAVPDVRLFPLPVYPQAGGRAERGPGLRLEAEEYTKYLLTASGLSVWFPHREAVSAARSSAGGEG